MTKASPLSDWIAGSRVSRADRPPAEAPMPTTGTVVSLGGSSFAPLPPSAFALAIAAQFPSKVARGSRRGGEAAPQQLAHQQSVFLVVARPLVEMIGEIVPVSGAFPLGHLAG